MIVLGNYSNSSLFKLCTSELFMHGKKIRGFNLEYHLKMEVSKERRKQMMRIVEGDFNHGGKLFGNWRGGVPSEFKEFKFEDWKEAVNLEGEGLPLLKLSTA